jgi:hypothetical protein
MNSILAQDSAPLCAFRFWLAAFPLTRKAPNYHKESSNNLPFSFLFFVAPKAPPDGSQT